MKIVRTLGLTAALAACVAVSSYGQVQPGRLQVTPYAGVLLMDNASALNNMPILGIEGLVYANQNVGIGFYGSYSQGESDGSFFPAMRWDVGPDTTLLIHVGQDVSALTYGAIAKLGLDAGRLSPYVAGGVGGYTVFLDPQSNDRPRRMGDFMYQFGGGFHYSIGESVGVRLDVRDLIFTGFDRDDLYPVAELFQTDVFLEAMPPEAKSTIHNISLTIGFTAYMGGR